MRLVFVLVGRAEFKCSCDSCQSLHWDSPGCDIVAASESHHCVVLHDFIQVGTGNEHHASSSMPVMRDCYRCPRHGHFGPAATSVALPESLTPTLPRPLAVSLCGILGATDALTGWQQHRFLICAVEQGRSHRRFGVMWAFP